MAEQATLLGWQTPAFDADFSRASRIDVGRGAWLEHVPAWLVGHATLFAHLRDTTAWRAERRRMYERVVDVPRLTARIPADGPGHPLLGEASAALSDHYGRALVSVSLALYRDGRDSVAWHGDRMGVLKDDTVVVVLTLGGPRRFLVRPAGGGHSMAFSLAWGDLFAMGGTAQRTFEHCVPKCADAAPRIAVMFRERPPAAE